MDRDELQRITLRLLAKDRIDSRLGRGNHYLADAIKEAAQDKRISKADIQKTVWSLVSQGLAYIDFSQPAPENWYLLLTEAGYAAVHDEEVNPNDPFGYLKRLNDVPGISAIVKKYASEAVHAYNSQLYLASAVMIGVASEAAFLELGAAFSRVLSEQSKDRFLSVFDNPKQTYIAKFAEFRKRLEPRKPMIPEELSDGMELWLNSVLDLLRVYRNDGGHPTGKSIDRDDCFINLRMFARYIKKMYLLKGFFEKS